MLLNIHVLHTQMYTVANFQLHMPNTFQVTALQSTNTRKIDLYSQLALQKCITGSH